LIEVWRTPHHKPRIVFLGKCRNRCKITLSVSKVQIDVIMHLNDCINTLVGRNSQNCFYGESLVGLPSKRKSNSSQRGARALLGPTAVALPVLQTLRSHYSAKFEAMPSPSAPGLDERQRRVTEDFCSPQCSFQQPASVFYPQD
jgi:hypothetical protein